MVLRVCDDSQADPYTEAEIAADLARFRATLPNSSPAGQDAEPANSTAVRSDPAATAERVEPYDIADTTIALEADGDAKPLDVRETVWDYAATGRTGGISRLVSRADLAADWTQWKAHTGGDAVIMLFDGVLEVLLDDGSRRTSVTLDRPGAFARIPRDVWHTVTVHRAATALTVTPCARTRTRER